jgi:hypothetical protein
VLGNHNVLSPVVQALVYGSGRPGKTLPVLRPSEMYVRHSTGAVENLEERVISVASREEPYRKAKQAVPWGNFASELLLEQFVDCVSGISGRPPWIKPFHAGLSFIA